VRRLPVWIGLSIFLAAGAVGTWFATRLAFAPLRTRSMPGFDIDLPAGEEKDYPADYGEGHLTINDPRGIPAQLQLRWEPGGLADDKEVALTIKMAGAAYNAEPRPISPPPKVEMAGQETRSWAARVGRETMWETEAVCGARRVSLVTSGARVGTERLHRRVARSFRCRPDPAREPTVGKDKSPRDIPVAFDVGPGWFLYRKSQEQYLISNRRAILTARLLEVPPPTDRAMTGKVLGLVPGLKLGDPVGDDWPVEMTKKGKTVHAWVTLRSCSSKQQLLIFAVPVVDGAGDGHEFLSRARCRKRGEPPQTFPEMTGAWAAEPLSSEMSLPPGP
jgi:hypothetical protein